MKCRAAINKWKYSQRYISNRPPPLYSVAYPATTSASVSEWSKGVRFDSKIKMIINPEAMGMYNMINQKKF